MIFFYTFWYKTLTFIYLFANIYTGDFMNKDCIVTKINSIILFDGRHNKEGFSSFRPFLPYNELILHLSGESTINFDGKIYHCEKGTLRYLPKGAHKIYEVRRHQAGDCIDIFFDTDLPLNEESFSFNMQNNIALQALFKKASSLWLSKSEGYYHKCISILYEIISELENHNYAPKVKFKILEPAINYINENFLKDKISVEHLARISRVSQSYLKKLFVKSLGVTPVKYIIQLKTSYAADLLKTEMYTVSQVAKICGYSNVYFFSRQFKEYVGISPSDYRKNEGNALLNNERKEKKKCL